jgi:hypothetical protein
VAFCLLGTRHCVDIYVAILPFFPIQLWWIGATVLGTFLRLPLPHSHIHIILYEDAVVVARVPRLVGIRDGPVKVPDELDLTLVAALEF